MKNGHLYERQKQKIHFCVGNSRTDKSYVRFVRKKNGENDYDPLIKCKSLCDAKTVSSLR